MEVIKNLNILQAINLVGLSIGIGYVVFGVNHWGRIVNIKINFLCKDNYYWKLILHWLS